MVNNKNDTHTVIGFFDNPDFKTLSLMHSLESSLGPVRFFIVWDNSNAAKKFDVSQFKQVTVIDKVDLIEACSRLCSIDVEQIKEIAEGFKLVYKVLLAIYCRKILGIDYCIMTDNDIFIFEKITEIEKLSMSKQPFLIQEINDAYRIPDISDLIKRFLNRSDVSPIPSKGKGYNVGFCGMDLTMFDAFESDAFSALLVLFSKLDVWQREQAFFVSMIFAFSDRVHTFDNERYIFLSYDDPCYRMKSKIFHCINTSDKSQVDEYYKRGNANSSIEIFNRLNCGVRSIVLLFRRIAGPIYRRMFKRYEPGANRYRHLLDYLRQTYCNRILEIGVWQGDTSRLMLRFSKNRQIEYHGIDVFESSTSELVQSEVSLVAHSIDTISKRLRKLSKSVFLHKGYSTEAFPKMRDAGLEFDCIWIDGGHSYETVKFDFEHYSQLLRKDGIIFIDDYTSDSYLPDVKRYVDNELITNPRFKVEIHTQSIDYYRGYAYKVVSVRLLSKEVSAKPANGKVLKNVTP